jgi:hypothetical protein
MHRPGCGWREVYVDDRGGVEGLFGQSNPEVLLYSRFLQPGDSTGLGVFRNYSNSGIVSGVVRDHVSAHIPGQRRASDPRRCDESPPDRYPGHSASRITLEDKWRIDIELLDESETREICCPGSGPALIGPIGGISWMGGCGLFCPWVTNG